MQNLVVEEKISLALDSKAVGRVAERSAEYRDPAHLGSRNSVVPCSRAHVFLNFANIPPSRYFGHSTGWRPLADYLAGENPEYDGPLPLNNTYIHALVEYRALHTSTGTADAGSDNLIPGLLEDERVAVLATASQTQIQEFYTLQEKLMRHYHFKKERDGVAWMGGFAKR